MSDTSETRDRLRRALGARAAGRLQEARRDLLAIADACRRRGERRELIHALKGLGQVERDGGHLAAARSLYEEALALSREEDDPRLVAHTVRHVGDIHRQEGRLDEAERCYLEALELYRAAPGTSPVALANALRPLALLRQRTGPISEARDLWREARDLYRSAGVDAGVEEAEAALRRLGEGP